MATIPFALSISHFVNSVGAKAGFAAIIGLAILVLLYFAQARETATLREHAAEASERIRQLEGRIAQLHRAQASATAAAAPQAQALRQAQASRAASGAPAYAGTATGSPVPAVAGIAAARIAPAGVAAPALSAATKLIPTDVPGPATALAEPPPPAVGAATPAGANGHARPRPDGVPRPTPAAGQSPPRVQIRPPAPPPAAPRRPATVPPGLDDHDDGPMPIGRLIAYVLGALLLIGVIVFALVSVTSGGDNGPAASASVPTTNAPATTVKHKQPGTVTVNPASVAVTVLNGTGTANVAKAIAGKLAAAGYKQGSAPGNAPEQTHATTLVAYLPGARRDALAVARSLGLSTSAVAAIDANTQTVACPPPATCTSNVVVTVGSDLAGGSLTSTGSSAQTATAPGASTTTVP